MFLVYQPKPQKLRTHYQIKFVGGKTRGLKWVQYSLQSNIQIDLGQKTVRCSLVPVTLLKLGVHRLEKHTSFWMEIFRRRTVGESAI